MTRENTFLASFLLAIALFGAHIAHAEQVYRWVDENGQVHFGDSVPAEYAEQEKLIMNEDGVTIGRIAGRATPEEIAAIRAAEEAKAAKERARRADRALLATYLSVGEIERHRDRRVELLESQAKVSQLYLNNLRKRLISLLDDASGFKPYTVDPDAPMIRPVLADDIKDTKDRILKYEGRIADHRREAKSLRDEFQLAIDRYTRLTTASNN
ncbi:MAG: DUF4124 domain-containing protein [Woeseiaceae bacterium]